MIHQIGLKFDVFEAFGGLGPSDPCGYPQHGLITDVVVTTKRGGATSIRIEGLEYDLPIEVYRGKGIASTVEVFVRKGQPVTGFAPQLVGIKSSDGCGIIGGWRGIKIKQTL